MTRRWRNILPIWLLAFLPVMLSVAPAMAQSPPVYAGQSSVLSVEAVPGDTYTWELYNDVTGINFATDPGNCPIDQAVFAGGINTGPSVTVNWLKPGIYFFKVTAVNTCPTNNLEVGMIEVKEALPTAILSINPEEVCVGDVANLSVAFTGKEPWSFKLQVKDANGITIQEFKDITDLNNPLIIPVGPAITTEYTVIEVTDANGVQKDPSNTVILKVNPLPRSSKIYVKQN
jgi:hypothetical protein